MIDCLIDWNICWHVLLFFAGFFRYYSLCLAEVLYLVLWFRSHSCWPQEATDVWMPGVVSVCHRSPYSSFAKTLWGKWLLQVSIIYLCWTWIGAPASVTLLLAPQVAAVCGVLPGHSCVSVPKTDGEDLCCTAHPHRGVFWALGEQICCSSLTQIY